MGKISIFRKFTIYFFEDPQEEPCVQKLAYLNNLGLSCYVFRDFREIAILSLRCWFSREFGAKCQIFSKIGISSDYFLLKYVKQVKILKNSKKYLWSKYGVSKVFLAQESTFPVMLRYSRFRENKGISLYILANFWPKTRHKMLTRHFFRKFLIEICCNSIRYIGKH